MAIKALPESTVHLLGSAQALTSPTSLVKELIDNSIDAHATSIDILISPNTLDKIEVRDNGHGISSDDLDALGRRGHTSKLRTFDDLKSVGGVSLGFRGEALASAVQLGEVSVATRTDGELVANLVKLRAPGGIASQTRTSHPVGTTVTVAKFMSKIPVRKQNFLKEATKTLVKIKELLQAYSLARPHLRFSLKVTKGGKGSWSFAPRPNDRIREAVAQAINRDLAAQCIEKSLVFPEREIPAGNRPNTADSGDSQKNAQSNSSFVVQAFLPKADADMSKIGYGQFISIDSRPVSNDKGTMRKIVTMYKYYVKGALAEETQKPKNPFLRLNIKCADASYDPNLEPAKDDVLFENESYVLDSIEVLFKEVYGEPKAASPKATSGKQFSKKLDDFELLLARTPPTTLGSTSESVIIRDDEAQPCETTRVATTANEPAKQRGTAIVNLDYGQETVGSNKRKWGYGISKDCSEEVEGSSKSKQWSQASDSAQSPVSDSVVRPADHLNPWIIAKLNAPVRESINEPLTRIISNSNRRANANPTVLPTPEHSSSPMSPGPGLRARSESEGRARQMSRNDDIRTLNLRSGRENSVQDDQEIAERVYRRPQTAASDDDMLLVGDDSEAFRRRSDFVSARHAPAPDNPTTLPAALAPKAARKQRGINKPFVPTLRTIENPASTDSLRQTTLTGGFSPVNRDDDHVPGSKEGLAWAMDYENRKDNVTRRRREELRASKLVADANSSRTGRSSPHQNRYHAAIATLENDEPRTKEAAPLHEPFKTTLPDEDPRGYLMRRQKSMSALASKHGGPGKLSRAKSMRLPLETIPNQAQLHDLILSLPTSIPGICHASKRLGKEDTYIDLGIHKAGLKMNTLETTQVATRVEETVNKWLETESGKDYEVQFEFENLINL